MALTRKAAFGLALSLCLDASAAAADLKITDKASAVDAAKRYLKTRCTAETPCTFKPEHEGKQWRVWVQQTRVSSNTP